MPPAGPKVRWLRNQAHTLILLAAMGALAAYCGWIVAGNDGIAWSVLVGTMCLIALRHVPADALLKALQARPLPASQALAISPLFAGLCGRAGLRPVPRLYRIEQELPLAFSLGEGNAAAIVMADCLLEHLSTRELCGILAHEIVHLRNGDLLLMQLGLVFGWATRTVSQVGCILVLISLLAHAFSLADFPLTSLLVLVLAPLGSALLRLAMARDREAEADLEAAELTGDPAGLASALVKLRDWQQRQLRRAFPFARSVHLPTLLADHPPTEDRIRRLREMEYR